MESATITELLALILLPVVSYLLKFVVKPSKTEIKIITQVISFAVVMTLRWLRKRGEHQETREHLSNVRQELGMLKVKLRSEKEALG